MGELIAGHSDRKSIASEFALHCLQVSVITETTENLCFGLKRQATIDLGRKNLFEGAHFGLSHVSSLLKTGCD